MAGTDDIARRLRAHAHGGQNCSHVNAPLLDEAADAIDAMNAERDAIGRLMRGESDILPLDTPLLITFAELIRVSDERIDRVAAKDERIVSLERQRAAARDRHEAAEAVARAASAIRVVEEHDAYVLDPYDPQHTEKALRLREAVSGWMAYLMSQDTGPTGAYCTLWTHGHDCPTHGRRPAG